MVSEKVSLERLSIRADYLQVRKMDIYLLPYLSIMYFFNSVDRVSSDSHSQRRSRQRLRREEQPRQRRDRWNEQGPELCWEPVFVVDPFVLHSEWAL